MVILFVVLFVAIAITVTWYRGVLRDRALSLSPIVKKQAYQFKMENLNIPAGIYFSPTHSWAHMQTNGRARIGADAFLHGGRTGEIEVAFAKEHILELIHARAGEQPVQPPEPGPGAVVIDAFHVPVALSGPGLRAHDLGQEGL